MNAQKIMCRGVALLLALLLAFGFFAAPLTYAEELPVSGATAEEQALLAAASEEETVESGAQDDILPAAEPEAPAVEQEVLTVEQDNAVEEISSTADAEEADSSAGETTGDPQNLLNAETTTGSLIAEEEAPQEALEEPAEPQDAVTYASLTETIPVINSSILSDTSKFVVLIDGNGVQTGYATLKAAMEAIPAASPGKDDCTIVFVQNYSMVAGTDRDAITANSERATALTVTSTYSDGTNTKTCNVKTASNNSTAFDWNFKSATTLVHHFNFTTGGCARFLACGNDLTMGTGITIPAANNVQLFVGGSTAVTSDHGSLTVVSGNFNSVFAAGYSGNNVYTGHSTVEIQNGAVIKTVYAGGSTAKFASDATVDISIDGGNPVINSGSFGAVNGLSTAGSLDITLKDITRNALDLTVNNAAPATLHTRGTTAINGAITAANLKVDDGTLTSNNTVALTGDLTVADGATYTRTAGALSAVNISVGDNATLTSPGDLTATGNLTLGNCASMTSNGAIAVGGDLTLATGATYQRTGTGSQTVGGDLNVTGANAEIDIFKDGAGGVADRLTIGGSHTGTDLLKLALCDKNGTEVNSAHGDQLLAYTTKANANSGNYILDDSTGNKLFAVGGKIVVSDKDYAYPTYYAPVAGSADPNLYQYDEIIGTNNTAQTVYRKYVETSPGVWQAYASDANGIISGTPLTDADQDKERPLPNENYPVTEYNSCFGAMFRVDGIGAYRIAAAAATNAGSNTESNDDSNTASGDVRKFTNVTPLPDGSTSTNSSWAKLEQTNDACVIHKAYLVMTTTLANNSPTSVSRANAEALLNNPMRLIAEDGAVMLSNGYLPTGKVEEVAIDANIETAENVPTLLYHGAIEGTNRNLGEAMTITDVTDFVKEHGYGKYYGADIPAYNTDPDAAIAWRLIVIEEDHSIQNLRKVGIQMGPITNKNSNATNRTEIKLTLDGFTTPDPGTDFEGQLLMIGSDNLLKKTGTLGSNLHNSFSPNPDGTEDKDENGVDKHPKVVIPIGSNDPTTTGVDRPIDSTTDYWSQGFMDRNGTKLTANQVQPIRANGSMGLDLSLLDVTNKENTNWETTGGHNLYLVPQSPSVALYSNRDDDGIGYIDVLGLSTEIAIPVFETQITHADVAKPTIDGVDVVAGHTVVVKATAKNTTPDTGNHVRGTFNTQVVVTVDPKLTNLRKADGTGNENSIVATFYDYHRNTNTTEVKEIIGTYNAAKHTITFDFGSDFDYNDSPPTSSIDPEELHLFNSRDDRIELEFLATTEDDPTTIDNAAVEYNNTIGVFGHVLYQYDRFDDTDDTRYAYDEDDFDTYLHDVTFTKVVKGDITDPDKEFTFVVTIWDKDGNLLPKDKSITYVRDKLGGVPTAEVPKPPDGSPKGTLTVDENGQVTFTLKHGQTITLQNMPLGSVHVAETGADDYTLSYNLTTQDSEGKVTTITSEKTLKDHTTGTDPIGIKDDPIVDYTFNFTNTKESIVPTSVRTKALPFLILALAALGGLALTMALGLSEEIRRRRE